VCTGVQLYLSSRVSLIDLSSMLSKDGETRNELDLMLSTLGTPEPHSTLLPCSTAQQSSTQIVDVSRPSSTDEIHREMLATSGPYSTSHESHLMMESVSADITEAQFSSVTQHRYNISPLKSGQAFISVGGSHSVLEASDVSHSNQNCEVVPSTSSTHLDLDRSIVMTSELTTSTPLDTDESTLARTVPSSSACIVNMEQQFAAEHTSLTHGWFDMFALNVGCK